MSQVSQKLFTEKSCLGAQKISNNKKVIGLKILRRAPDPEEIIKIFLEFFSNT